jgi:hypothetical protein
MKVSGQLHAPAALPTDKSLRYPLDTSRSGSCGVKKLLLPLPGIEPRPSTRIPSLYQTELSRLPLATHYQMPSKGKCWVYLAMIRRSMKETHPAISQQLKPNASRHLSTAEAKCVLPSLSSWSQTRPAISQQLKPNASCHLSAAEAKCVLPSLNSRSQTRPAISQQLQLSIRSL